MMTDANEDTQYTSHSENAHADRWVADASTETLTSPDASWAAAEVGATTAQAQYIDRC